MKEVKAALWRVVLQSATQNTSTEPVPTENFSETLSNTSDILYEVESLHPFIKTSVK